MITLGQQANLYRNLKILL